MKHFLNACILILLSPTLIGQGFNDFTAIDHKASFIPRSETHSSTSIATYIQTQFKTDRDKLRAIYAWVINNIRYDTDSMYHINWSLEQDDKISATLRRRKGVCENYASLFTDIALKSNIPSVVVNGLPREWSNSSGAGHSWSAVYLDKEWYFCDPTWDVGNRKDTRYFLIKPEQFIVTHLPFDPLWQLLDYPVSEKEFRQGYSRSKIKQPPFNFTDSAFAFLQLDSLQRLEASTRRIKQLGIENDRQKNWLAYNQMKIAMVYGEKDMELYNAAVADLNSACEYFNDFVRYRNNQFTPARTDRELRSLMDPIPVLLASAFKKLDQMGQVVENFQYDTGGLKDKINQLDKRVQEQSRFLNRYLASSLADRGQLFYQ